jgi:hypothetical protein
MKAADHVFELHYNAALLAHRQGDLQEAVSQVRVWLPQCIHTPITLIQRLVWHAGPAGPCQAVA